MYFKIDLEDGISPVVQRWLKNNPRFISSVLKSTGYMVQNELKEAVRGKFTGQSWPQRWTLQDRQKLSNINRIFTKKSYLCRLKANLITSMDLNLTV